MSKKKPLKEKQELDVLQDVVHALTPMEEDRRECILRAVAAFYDVQVFDRPAPRPGS